MGLFWSMLPKERMAPPFKMGDRPMPITLTATCGDEHVTETTIIRLPMLPTMARREIREEGLVGTLFHDSSMRPRPGIIVLGGGGGGIYERMARWYASHGFAAFTLGYFGNLIMQRLEANEPTANRLHLCCPGAGHFVPTAAYSPSSDHPEWWGEGLNCWMSAGGTAAVNAHAAADARNAILTFLETHL